MSFSTRYFSVILSWLVPGAGYWVLGEKFRAVLLFSSITGLFWFGQYLTDFRAVNRDIHPIFFVGQAGNGLSTLISEFRLKKDPIVSRGVSRNLSPHLNTGINFTTISGLLNILIILHIADPKTWSPAMADKDVNSKNSSTGKQT